MERDMEVVTTRTALEKYLEGRPGSETGFVPTMGALHEGHMSLMVRARGENDTVVTSVFVNPTQFNDPEDLRRYPRTPERDLQMLGRAGVDLVFMPSVEEIYPEPDTRVFDLGALDRVMEGATRPGHFNGVAQVVSRLFDMVQPGRAYFGEKDFQQVAVIRRMVELLGLPVQIVTCPTVREEDGLAMSSRNALLDGPHRKAAPGIYAALCAGVDMMEKGGSTPTQVEKFVTDTVNAEPLLRVIYFEIVNAATMQKAADWEEKPGVQGCIAVQAGSVRLIDNIRFR